MLRPSRLVLAPFALLAVACAGDPTSPTARTPQLRNAPTTNADAIDGTNADGTCRSGFSVSNGICVPN